MAQLLNRSVKLTLEIVVEVFSNLYANLSSFSLIRSLVVLLSTLTELLMILAHRKKNSFEFFKFFFK